MSQDDVNEPKALTHIGADGSARMVDVGDKQPTTRIARARGEVHMSSATARAVEAGDAPKGDVIGTARIAGILAAKRVPELIPLAHPLPLDKIDIEITVDAERGVVAIEAETRTHARTGVEIEAIAACSIAALTVYDMVKGVERGVTIERVRLIEKSGGRHDWRADEKE